jgi:hypothetical protein
MLPDEQSSWTKGSERNETSSNGDANVNANVNVDANSPWERSADVNNNNNNTFLSRLRMPSSDMEAQLKSSAATSFREREAQLGAASGERRRPSASSGESNREAEAEASKESVTTSNDDTLSAGNTEKHRRGDFTSLSDLFEVPQSRMSTAAPNNNNNSYPPLSPRDPLAAPSTSTTSAHSYLPVQNAHPKPPPPPPAAALPPRPPAINHHNRAVSWGKVDFKPPSPETQTRNNNGNGSHSPPSLQQQPSDGSDVFSSLEGSLLNENINNDSNHQETDRRKQLHQQHNRTASRARINSFLSLEDILHSGPYEQEAETHILKALEQTYQDQYNTYNVNNNNNTTRPRSDTATSTILTQVPESALHDFSLSPVSDDNDHDHDNNNNGAAENNPLLADNDHDPDDHDHVHNVHNNAAQGGDMENCSPPASIRSIRSHAQQVKPLLHATHSSGSGRPPLPPSHTRNMSVEQTLFGLTSAMSALYHDEKPVHTNIHNLHHHHDSVHNNNTTASGGKEDDDLNTGSADNFARNAVLLSRVDEEAPTGSTPTSPLGKDRWEHLRGNLPTLVEDHSNPEPATEEMDASVHAHQGKVDGTTAHVENGVPEDEREAPTGASANGHGASNSGRGRQRNRRGSVFEVANDKMKEDLALWKAFFRPRKDNVWTYIKTVLLYLMFPALGIAAILYYFCENPPTGKGGDKDSSKAGASASWWLLFMCVRQVITFSLALGMQGVMIDFLSLGSRVMLRLVGPVITLLIVTAKGWPFIVFWWAIFDFAMLHGEGAFAKHWAFWQDAIDMFNSNNPSGNIVNNEWNTRVLSIAISVSVVVAVKRFVVGLYLGRQTFCKFVSADFFVTCMTAVSATNVLTTHDR